VEEALVEEDVALGVRDHCRIPPRLLAHVLLASLVIVSSTLLSPAIKGLLLEGIRVDRELVFVELDLVLVSGTPLHGAVSCLHEAYGRLLLPARIICELDYFALLCLDDLGLDYGLYGLPAALMPLCLDLSTQWLLTIPLIYKLKFGPGNMGLGPLVNYFVRLLRLLRHHLLLLMVLVQLHQVDGLVIRRTPGLYYWFGGWLALDMSLGGFGLVLITI
jgi:hypothetical protein